MTGLLITTQWHVQNRDLLYLEVREQNSPGHGLQRMPALPSQGQLPPVWMLPAHAQGSSHSYVCKLHVGSILYLPVYVYILSVVSHHLSDRDPSPAGEFPGSPHFNLSASRSWPCTGLPCSGHAPGTETLALLLSSSARLVALVLHVCPPGQEHFPLVRNSSCSRLWFLRICNPQGGELPAVYIPIASALCYLAISLW